MNDQWQEFPSIVSKHREKKGRPEVVQRIDDYPCGYPQLAAFMKSDENFLIARKYGFLRSRVLIYHQDKLSVLERDLIKLDEDDEKEKNKQLALMSRERDNETHKDFVCSRKILLRKIDDKLKEYDELVTRNETYLSLKALTSRNAKTFFNLIEDHKSLSPKDSTFIRRKDDLITLSGGQEYGWLNGMVKRLFKARFDGSTRNAPNSTAEPLLSSRDLHIKHPSHAAPPPGVGAVATERTQTATSTATSAQLSSTSSVQPSSYPSAETEDFLKSNLLSICPKLLCSDRLGYLLAFSCIISHALAAEDSAIPTSQPGPPWPLSEGPPGLGDSIIAITSAIIIIILSYSARKWPWKFQDSVLWVLLLGFCTFGGFCIMGDARTSLTNLLSIGLLQVYFGQHFARMRHRINGHDYTMSFHFWLPIFALTVVFALLCMKASPTMYNQNAQLPGFPFTIPCFGMAVILCVYLGYLWNLWNLRVGPRLPWVQVVWP